MTSKRDMETLLWTFRVIFEQLSLESKSELEKNYHMKSIVESLQDILTKHTRKKLKTEEVENVFDFDVEGMQDRFENERWNSIWREFRGGKYNDV